MSLPSPETEQAEAIETEIKGFIVELCTKDGAEEWIYEWEDDVNTRLALIYQMAACNWDDQTEAGRQICGMIEEQLRDCARWKLGR